MKLQTKISQAKAKLLVEYPYFGTLASKVTLSLNDDIQSFKSDGTKLEYNSDYIESLEVNELEFLFANAAMHKSLAHENRKNGRSGWLWQMATDMAINGMLVENGLELPYGAEYRVRFEGMYAEEIYAELKSDMLRDDEDLEYETDDSDDVEQNDKERDDTPQTQQELQEEILKEQLAAEEAISLLESEFKKGEAPQSIERFFKLEISGKINWRDELKSAIDRYFRDDYVLIPPNKKFISQGIYLPSALSQTVRLLIVIDSSGSIDEDVLSEFLSEVSFLMALWNNYQIELLVCDDKVHSHNTFYTGDSLEVSLKGNGSTDFRAAFRFVEENFDDVKLLLYFTDLEGVFPKEIPNYDVKWISSKSGEVPFGEVIIL